MSATRYNICTNRCTYTLFIYNMSSYETPELCTCCYPYMCCIIELSRQIATVKKKWSLCHCLWP